MAFLKTILSSLTVNDSNEIWKSEIQTLTEQLENRNTEHNKLEKFKSTLQETYESLATHNQTIKYYNFTYELLKDGGVKTKIIKKYLPLINQQVNRYLQMMDFLHKLYS